MDSRVLQQAVVGAVRDLAIAAHERGVRGLRVHAQVPGEMVGQHIRLGAVLARIGSLAGVGHEMTGQLGGGGEASLAMLAGEGKIGGVYNLEKRKLVS